MKDGKLGTHTPVAADVGAVTTWALPEGAIARLERGGVCDMAFSPDGHYLVIATKIGIWWYEMTTMSPVALWDMERGMVGSVVFSPNGKWIATSNWDKVLKVWDVQRGVCVTQIELGFWDSFAFSSDNRWLAIGNRDTATIKIYHPETGETLTKFIGEAKKGGSYMPIAFSPDTCLLASTSRDDPDDGAESIVVWDVGSGEQISCLTEDTRCVYHLCFSPCGRFLTSGGAENGTVHVWDADNWKLVKVYTGYGESQMIPSYSSEGVIHTAVVSSDDNIATVWNLEKTEKLYTANSEGTVAFANGSQLAYQYGHQFLEVWTMDNPHPRRTIQTHLSFVDTSNSLAFLPDGKTLAAEYRYGPALLWDITSKQSQLAINANSEEKKQYLYTSPDGKSYIACINKNIIRLWEIGDDAIPIFEFTEHEKEWDVWVRPGFVSTVNLLACADQEGNLIVWDVQNGDTFCKMTPPLREVDSYGSPDSYEICLIKFSADGRFLASEAHCDIPNVRLWDVKRGTEIAEFPTDKIVGIKGFSPCSAYLVCKSVKTSDILLWDVERREIFTTVQGGGKSEFAYSLCGSYIAWGGEEDILLWNVKRREIHKRISLSECEWTHTLAFSRCGQYLAFGAEWHKTEKVPVKLWEVETGKHIVTFWGHTTDVQAVAFAPNNELLASASFDGSIILWDLKPYL